jgi:hypothetical protein
VGWGVNVAGSYFMLYMNLSILLQNLEMRVQNVFKYFLRTSIDDPLTLIRSIAYSKNCKTPYYTHLQWYFDFLFAQLDLKGRDTVAILIFTEYQNQNQCKCFSHL